VTLSREELTHRVQPWLEPISAATPSGSSARYEPEYERILLEVGKLEAPTGGAVDWVQVATLGKKLLGSKSKDLLLAARLLEALLKVHGFGGLRDGLLLMRRLIEDAWDRLNPPIEEGDLDVTWEIRPQLTKFIAFGTKFEDSTYQQNGHIQVDFGLDTPFLYEDVEFTEAVEKRIKSNVQKLINFTTAVEKNCGISGRVLWSESEDNLAQKLIERLQKVQ